MTLNSQSWWEQNEPKLIDHKAIIIHHTDGPVNQTVEQIDDEHKAEGWAGIGYHRFIDEAGVIHEGRPDDVMGAQAKGYNEHSVGIAVAGNFMNKLPNDAQWAALRNCCAIECKRWGTPVDHIIGHRDVSALVHDRSVSTACPGDALYAALPRLRAEVEEYLNK